MDRDPIPEQLRIEVPALHGSTWLVENDGTGVTGSAHVNEHFADRIYLSCGVVSQTMTPDQARDMARALNEVADRAIERRLWIRSA